MSTLRKIMLITGASSGIGADLARYAAAKGHDLGLVARNGAALDALADELAASPQQKNPRPLVFAKDLAQPGAVAALVAEVEAAGATPEILVNNAGYGVLGPATEGDLAEQMGIIDLNIRALTELSLVFAPKLIAAKGRLLNVASIVAFMPGPGMAIYYASKAYVLSFSEALSAELAPSGVSVTALCPGAVVTGFQQRARFTDSMNQLVRTGLKSSEVAKIGYEGMMAGKRVVIAGLSTKLMVWSMRFVPKSALLKVVGSMQMRRAGKAREGA
jgi:short-subunit dehydrogenase